MTARRHVNCLLDRDRIVRRNAVVHLNKILTDTGKVPREYAQRLFLEDLHKPLFQLFADPGEKCRETAISLVASLVEDLAPENLENLLPLLLAALLARFRSLPFPEQSEEIRLELLHLLRSLMDKGKEFIASYAGDIIDGLAKALTDTCPDAKKECCEIIRKIVLFFDPERISNACGPMLSALIGNLKHQHWKVRRATLDCLGALLSEENIMLDHVEEVLPHLSMILSDRTAAVRHSLTECLQLWLVQGMGFRKPSPGVMDDDDVLLGFAKVEHRLLSLLLSNLADTDVELVAVPAFHALEKVATRKHEVRLEQAKKDVKKAETLKARSEAPTAGVEVGSAGVASAGNVEVDTAPEFDYSSVSSFLPEPFSSGGAPASVTTTYIRLHAATILIEILGNVTQWTTDIRTSAARRLQVTVILLNKQIAPFLEQVLVHLYRASADEEATVVKTILLCADLLGAFIQPDLYLGLVGKHLGLKDGAAERRGFEDLWPESRTGRSVTHTVVDVTTAVKNFAATTPESLRQVLTVLARLIRPTDLDSVSEMQHQDVRVVIHCMQVALHHDDLSQPVFAVAKAVLRANDQACSLEWASIFDLLLQMRSGEECNADAVDDSMDQLALICGASRRDLYEQHLRGRLGELLDGGDLVLWEERSQKRHILETLLRNVGAAIESHLEQLIPVLSRQSSPEDAPILARADILGIVHFLVTQEDPKLTDALRRHMPAMLRGIVMPNGTWQIGRPNERIRHGAMVCFHAMLRQRLVEPCVLSMFFPDLLPILKSCLDDSWSPDNRMIGCLVLSCLLREMRPVISGEQLREIYPDLLKRLDDSNDKIRVVVCDALRTFFECLPSNWSRSIFEYILKTLFVHLDDTNTEIQRGVYTALESAMSKDAATFVREAQASAAKSVHSRQCENLARQAMSLQVEDMGDAENIVCAAMD